MKCSACDLLGEVDCPRWGTKTPMRKTKEAHEYTACVPAIRLRDFQIEKISAEGANEEAQTANKVLISVIERQIRQLEMESFSHTRLLRVISEATPKAEACNLLCVEYDLLVYEWNRLVECMMVRGGMEYPLQLRLKSDALIDIDLRVEAEQKLRDRTAELAQLEKK
jgi:hypothetical protein